MGDDKLVHGVLIALIALAVLVAAKAGGGQAPEGFTPLFNGKDFTGWKVPEGDNGHWKVTGRLSMA